MKRTTTMSAKVEEYLRFRRGLGYRLKIEGQMLQNFGRFADASGHRGPLTVELALRWAQSAEGCDRLYCGAAIGSRPLFRPPLGRCGAAHRNSGTQTTGPGSSANSSPYLHRP